jgi:hypothetical protein
MNPSMNLRLPWPTAAACLMSLPLQAALLEFPVNEAIPDGLGSGIADTRTVAGLPASVLDLRIRLNLAGAALGGMINGDIYATVAYESTPGQVDAFTVLLNRTGRSASNPDGYFDNGFNVSFVVAGADIHTYQDSVIPGSLTPLTGEWSPDGRETDPSLTLDTDIRTAGLTGFQSINPNGRWTLFVADLVPGGEAGLVSWGIEYTPVPEPGHWTGLAGLGLAAWAIARRRP